MTDTSKDAVERLLDGVTTGPWQAESGYTQKNGQLYWQVTDGSDAIVQNQFCWCQGDHNANARFIAAARELVPALLAEREALTAEVARRSEMHECAMVERDDCILDWSDTKAERDRLSAEMARLTAALEVERAGADALVKSADHLLQNYLRDELDEPELCVDDEHWSAIHDLHSVLAAHAARREGGAE